MVCVPLMIIIAINIKYYENTENILNTIKM